MKNIVFAMKMQGVNSTTIQQFEDRIADVLTQKDRSFQLGQRYHCDDKGGLLEICYKVKPDILIINEALPGKEDISDLIRRIKSELPEIHIIVLLLQERPVGDAFLATLVTLGIYDWCNAAWTPEAIADHIIKPKQLKDVNIYMPRIISNERGLAFDTVVIEKDDLSRLGDLDSPKIDIMREVNNAEKVNGISDLDTSPSHSSPHSASASSSAYAPSSASAPSRRSSYTPSLKATQYGFGETAALRRAEPSPSETPIIFTPTLDPTQKGGLYELADESPDKTRTSTPQGGLYGSTDEVRKSTSDETPSGSADGLVNGSTDKSADGAYQKPADEIRTEAVEVHKEPTAEPHEGAPAIAPFAFAEATTEPVPDVTPSPQTSPIDLSQKDTLRTSPNASHLFATVRPTNDPVAGRDEIGSTEELPDSSEAPVADTIKTFMIGTDDGRVTTEKVEETVERKVSVPVDVDVTEDVAKAEPEPDPKKDLSVQDFMAKAREARSKPWKPKTEDTPISNDKTYLFIHPAMDTALAQILAKHFKDKGLDKDVYEVCVDQLTGELVAKADRIVLVSYEDEAMLTAMIKKPELQGKTFDIVIIRVNGSLKLQDIQRMSKGVKKVIFLQTAYTPAKGQKRDERTLYGDEVYRNIRQGRPLSDERVMKALRFFFDVMEGRV